MEAFQPESVFGVTREGIVGCSVEPDPESNQDLVSKPTGQGEENVTNS